MLVQSWSLLVYLCYFIMKIIRSEPAAIAVCFARGNGSQWREMQASAGAGSAAPRFLAQCHVPLNSTVWVYEGHSSTVKLVYHTWPWGTPTGRLLPQSTGSYIVPRDWHLQNWGCHNHPDSVRSAGWGQSSPTPWGLSPLHAAGPSLVEGVLRLWQKV